MAATFNTTWTSVPPTPRCLTAGWAWMLNQSSAATLKPLISSKELILPEIHNLLEGQLNNEQENGNG